METTENQTGDGSSAATESTAIPPVGTPITAEFLATLPKKEDVAQLARERSLSTTGTRADIVARLLEYTEGVTALGGGAKSEDHSSDGPTAGEDSVSAQETIDAAPEFPSLRLSPVAKDTLHQLVAAYIGTEEAANSMPSYVAGVESEDHSSDGPTAGEDSVSAQETIDAAPEFPSLRLSPVAKDTLHQLVAAYIGTEEAANSMPSYVAGVESGRQLCVVESTLTNRRHEILLVESPFLKDDHSQDRAQGSPGVLLNITRQLADRNLL